MIRAVTTCRGHAWRSRIESTPRRESSAAGQRLQCIERLLVEFDPECDDGFAINDLGRSGAMDMQAEAARQALDAEEAERNQARSAQLRSRMCDRPEQHAEALASRLA